MKQFKEYYLQESIEDKGIFKAVFFGGSPGAGKTYTKNRINDGQIDPRVVNTDTYYEFLARSSDIDLGDDRRVPRWIIDQSKVLTKKQLVQNINSMLPLYIDGTSANASNLLKRQGILEGFGYDVGMVWVNTSLETAIERAKERERNVNEDFIRRTFEKLEENKSYYKTKFSTFVEVDNDEGALTNEAILNAYKKVSGFYDSSINNPIGKRNVDKLREMKEKYLSPELYDMSDIERQINIWYKKV